MVDMHCRVCGYEISGDSGFVCSDCSELSEENPRDRVSEAEKEDSELIQDLEDMHGVGGFVKNHKSNADYK